ncbi:transcriptional regulator [bacterium]|nr:MAG: transcriptional regulator [bacterium]
MISKSTEYALRAVLCLARSDGRVNVGQVAELTHVPSRYLAKVLQGLVRAGLVNSTRGRTGGFVLARDPATVTILEVVNAVDPLERICECPLGLEEHKDKLCALHQRLDDAIGEVEEAFRGSTLADILANPGPGWPLGAPERTPRSSK